MDEGEAVAERVSDDTEEMATVLTSMDAVIVLASGVVDVPTGSEEVPTACPVFAIATVVTPYRRRKGKEVMVKFETPKKQKVQEQIDAQIARELEEQHAREDQKRDEQIARDAEIARIHADEELHSMIDGLDSNNETVARYLEEYRQFSSELHMERRIELINDLVKYQDNYTNVYKFQSQQRKSWTKKQKRDYYMAMITNNLGWKSNIPLLTGRFILRVRELTGRLKGWEETLSTRPPTSDKEIELWVELSRLYEPDNEDQLQRQRNLYACGEGLPSEEGSSTYDDLLQASSGELLTDGKRSSFEDLQDCKLSKTAR
nr:hypothetical protein [Tanacetum cinerariifolium]